MAVEKMRKGKGWLKKYGIWREDMEVTEILCETALSKG